MAENISIQNVYCTQEDFAEFCSLCVETISAPTKPLLHQTSRFWFFTGGTGTLKLQDREYEIRPGTFVSVLPWQLSHIIHVEEPLQYYLFAYYFDQINFVVKNLFNINGQTINLIEDMQRTPVLYCDGAQSEYLQNLFETAYTKHMTESSKEAESKNHFLEIFMMNKIIEIMIYFLQLSYLPKKDQAPTVNTTIERSDIFCYMYNHLSQKITLESLSKTFFMSESAISSYITKTTGLSFYDLLNEMRIGKTINFLLYTDFTMEELAELLGFVDNSHICKVFSSKLGMRTNEFRKTYGKISSICKIDPNRSSYEIVHYIYRHYSEELTPIKIAEQFQISVKDLNTILLYQVEKNFTDFLNYIRVNRASDLLKNTDKCIIDIAVEVGYNNIKTLNRNFLRLRNMTPSAFRKEVELQKK